MDTFHRAYLAEIQARSGQPAERLGQLAREALLARRYDLGELSSGQAAGLLGVSRRDFLDLLGTYHVSVFDENLDIAEELRRSSEARRG